MPKPIVCLSAKLRQYLELFQGCFSKRQWKYFVIVLLGLVECEERKTMSGLLRVVGEKVSLSGLSRFFNKWTWQAEKLAKTWQAWFREQVKPQVQAEHERLKAEQPKHIGRPKATIVTGYLALDDSVHAKPKGRKMGGLGKHYSNTERHVVDGHNLFTGVYVLLGQRCPLQARLYRQKIVCEREEVPFQSKIDLAIEEIGQFEPAEDTETHVLVDSWYHCKAVRKAAQKRDWQMSGGLKSNRIMRIITKDGQREWLKLSEYAKRLKPEDWQVVIWTSEQGGQTMYACLVKTWIRKLGPTLLLITCHDLNEPLKSIRYWGSTVLELDAQSLVNILAIRWEVEIFFEDDKDLLGSDHYQLMTAQGIVRFWNLTACLLCFLEMQRIPVEDKIPTCGLVRRSIQAEHRKNLLHWLVEHAKNGLSAEQIGSQLAL